MSAIFQSEIRFDKFGETLYTTVNESKSMFHYRRYNRT